MKEKHKKLNIIALERFIEATRDAGYKNITSALAELIDNAFEANAKNVAIDISKDSRSGSVTVFTTDDGCGMKPSVLQIALQFGGSTRFNSRINSGRFGMGLPNSSLSQARCFEVFTWRTPKSVWRCHLDVDEIISGDMKTVPIPKKANPKLAKTESGTIVVWSKCDRIEFKNQKLFLRKIRKNLGRLFRKHLWAGKNIFVNGEKVASIDTLFLYGQNAYADPFGDKLKYRITIPNSQKEISTVTVQFCELPIEKWHYLTNKEKQEKGITKNAGVSIIRSGREIDHGWFFIGKKRKENYDDWWRCEICFEPQLDEVFGVTNTKQGIRPTEFLINILSPDIERIANTLNNRVRLRFAAIKAKSNRSTGEKIATTRDRLLEPPERTFIMNDNLSIYGLQPISDSNPRNKELIRGLNFRIETKKISDKSFYIPLLAAKEIVVLLNENHPFYECIFSPSVQSSNPNARQLRQYLELMLLSVARAECTVSLKDQNQIIKKMREEWSRVLATFLE